MTVLAWEGCLNVRDLGGHATEDGAVTRPGVVVRADALGRLSDAGWQALVDYGIARIVDLRLHDEREADPPRELPVELVHVQLVEIDPEYRELMNRDTDCSTTSSSRKPRSSDTASLVCKIFPSRFVTNTGSGAFLIRLSA